MEKGQDIGQNVDIRQLKTNIKESKIKDFVLEKSIFNNIFEKDIRRVFIYKKAERLAKAIHLITPAFSSSESLKDRIDAIAVGLVDAAIQSSSVARTSLSRELLTLSSILSIAEASGLLSKMNAELISRETQFLLQEVAEYEEPRLTFDESLSLSEIAQKAVSQDALPPAVKVKRSIYTQKNTSKAAPKSKGQIKDNSTLSDTQKDRREAVLSVIRNKKVASIKDISTVILDVSEKTIQRELISLVTEGIVLKQGERRWSTYSIA